MVTCYFTSFCSLTLLVQQRERLVASVAGSLGPSVFNFIVKFDSGKLLDTQIFKRQRRLAADTGIGRLTLTVK